MSGTERVVPVSLRRLVSAGVLAGGKAERLTTANVAGEMIDSGKGALAGRALEQALAGGFLRLLSRRLHGVYDDPGHAAWAREMFNGQWEEAKALKRNVLVRREATELRKRTGHTRALYHGEVDGSRPYPVIPICIPNPISHSPRSANRADPAWLFCELVPVRLCGDCVSRGVQSAAS